MGQPTPSFPIDLTEEETEYGFEIREAHSGVRAVVVELDGGLQAVKVREGNGTTAYAICDERLEPIYTAAKSLDELRGRFRPSRP